MLASLSSVARYAVKLYFRCQLFKEIALPEAGSVLDQSDLVVSMLETVHGFVVEHRNSEHEKMMRQNTKPSPSFPGVDSRDTENIHIGGYSRKVIK